MTDSYEKRLIEFIWKIPDILPEIKSVQQLHEIFLEILLVCDPNVFICNDVVHESFTKLICELQSEIANTSDGQTIQTILKIFDRLHQNSEFIDIPITIEFMLEYMTKEYHHERLKLISILHENSTQSKLNWISYENTLLKLSCLVERFNIVNYMMPNDIRVLYETLRDDIILNRINISNTAYGYQALIYVYLIDLEYIKLRDSNVVSQMATTLRSQICELSKSLIERLHEVGYKNVLSSSNVFVALCQLQLILRPDSLFAEAISAKMYKEMGHFLYLLMVKHVNRM